MGSGFRKPVYQPDDIESSMLNYNYVYFGSVVSLQYNILPNRQSILSSN